MHLQTFCDKIGTSHLEQKPNVLYHMILPVTELGITSTAIVVIAIVTQALKEIGIPFPGVTQSALIYAGYQLSFGDRFIALVIVMAILMGSISGSLFTYSMARFQGLKLVEKFGKYLRVTPQSLEQARNKLQPAAFLSVVVGRCIPGMMAPTSIASGIIRISISKFVAGVGLSVMVWAGAFITLGTLSGQIINQISPFIERMPLFLGLLAGGALTFGLAYLLWKRRRGTQIR